ncbi:hypothetical protein BU26DRAFT_387166, partial [Trematosphaeria pertusa]
VDVLAHFLGGAQLENAPHTLDDAVIVGLDTEWFERGCKAVTELGISIIDTLSLSRVGSPWTALASMQVHHARIMKNAHMVNGKKCAGHPDRFEFGATKFVTMEEARRLLLDSFSHSRGDGSLRPVIFIGHAVDNDVDSMKEHLGVDLNELGVIATALDTQAMATELGLVPESRLLSLKDLLAEFAIQEEYLHTAGNDIALTTIAAFLLTADHVAGSDFWRVAHNRSEVASLKSLLQSHPAPTQGITTFCTKCDSTSHMFAQCSAAVSCTECAANSDRSRFAHTHKTEKC